MVITKKQLVLIFIMALSIMHLSLLCPANSAEVPGDSPGTISVTGTAFDHYSPDTVEIVLAVQSMNISASEAAGNNRTIMDKVITKLKRLIDPEQDRIKTISYTLQPRYKHDRKQEKNILVGYTATNRVSIKTKKIDKAGDIIDSAVSSGANRVESINFSIVEKKEPCRMLLSMAAKSARDEADTVASSLDTKITGLKEASSSCSTDDHRPVMRAMMQEAAVARAATPVQAGDIRITATVRTVFLIR